MSPRSSRPGNRPAAIATCLMLLAVAVACISAASAHAAEYKMLLCAGNNGSNSFDTATNYGGQFTFENHCGPAPDPAGNNAFLRIYENSTGTANVNAYGSISWTVPPWIEIRGGGGYTREPDAFNDGWRGRFWAEDWGGGTNNILMQGTGADNSGINWSPTSTFASHLWPFSGFGNYRRFVFELTCFRAAGCDRSGFNAVDANSIALILDDVSPSQVNLTNTGAPFLGGQWVRGTQSVTYSWSDLGTGIRMERIRIDGDERFTLDHTAMGECDRNWTSANGEFARSFQPCATASNIGRSYTFDTASLPDGPHTVQACTQDYAQWQGLNGTGGESCDQRTVHTDNTPPGAPADLHVTSANPARYMDHFAASFSLPPNQGSPIAKVHYDITDTDGKVVVPEKVLSALNPTGLPEITGPGVPGDYRLRVWLEDEVGFSGPVASAPIPHDTTPPAAPQGISVASPQASRSQEGFDLRWHNIADSGSPVDAAHYQLLNGAGGVAVPTQTLSGENVEGVQSIETPEDSGDFSLRVWLTDAEGNVGAPATVPLSYECVRSEVQGGLGLSAGFEGSEGPMQIVDQGAGAAINGVLQGANGAPAGARLCVYGRVLTGGPREFLGIAVSGGGGRYRFPIEPGPSREFEVLYRPGQRRITSTATLYTRVKPTFNLRPRIVRNGHLAYFFGQIPGPDNNGVVVVLQVKQGKGWRAFGRYRTQGDGRFVLHHFFRRTMSPSRYVLRAQVRETVGYPYLEGNSQERVLHVLPAPAPR